MLANNIYEVEKGDQYNYNNRSGPLEGNQSQLPSTYLLTYWRIMNNLYSQIYMRDQWNPSLTKINSMTFHWK